MFNYEYVGNIHIHSIHSDGTKSYAEIAQRASEAGLDFVCINDHEYMKKSHSLDDEGFYGNVMLFLGLEIGKRYHHYLAFGVDELIQSDNLEPQEMIDKVIEHGGFGFLAHPFEKGMPFKEKSIAYTWNDLSVERFTGLSIWNFSSRWKERVKTLFHGIFYLLFKGQTLAGPSEETTTIWDTLCQQRRIVAVGGSDAHGSIFKWGLINFIPLTYDFVLRTINLHVLINAKVLKDFKKGKQMIYEAMQEGRLFIANDWLFPAKGFKFDFISDDGSDLLMGEEEKFRHGNLVIELPTEGEIRIIRDGICVKKTRGLESVFRVERKGVYRVVVYRKIRIFGWRPWIFSNPIYLR